jgi:hypothetical protein
MLMVRAGHAAWAKTDLGRAASSGSAAATLRTSRRSIGSFPLRLFV